MYLVFAVGKVGNIVGPHLISVVPITAAIITVETWK